MYWQNTDTIIKNESSSTQTSVNEGKKPQPRWGQACITAYNKLYIIGGYEGQYLGDVWAYDFNTLSYQDLKIEGENVNQLSRSNHTAVFYQKHNSIYVFGGGQSQRQRFNDTLKLEFEDPQAKVNTLKLTKVQYQDSSLPEARTYHASCLVNSFMVVLGGEANSDLKDFWALELDTMKWFRPTIEGFNNYTAKRFHTASTISDSKIITFGGCHSEYIHMNEMHLFDMTQFLSTYQSNPNAQILCTKIDIQEGIPSTRWGHSAATYKDKLYILGGRNEHDIIDLHEFDPEQSKWRVIDIQGQLPKARRRHSSLFVSGSLIMFGGFDGNFYNDLNILDFTKPFKTIIQIQPSTIEQEYAGLVNNEENSDIVFQLGLNSGYKIYAHKALVLFRALEREVQQQFGSDLSLQDLIHQRRVPEFLIKVYNSKPGSTIVIEEVFCKSSFLKLLEFLYCDKFLEQMTTLQVRAVSEVAKSLQLTNISNYLRRKVESAVYKIQEKIVSEFQQRQPLEPLNLTKPQQKLIKQKVESLESTLKFDFSQFEEFQIQSPEDNKDRQQYKAVSLMNQCKNLDEFYDIIFNVGDTLIKANSTVLMVRSPYFQSMLSSKYQFKESSQKNHGQIKVQGVPKSYFTNIIQYIYSDHFYIQRSEVDFFVKLLIYADYFMLPRLVDICSSYLKPFVSVKNVLKILLVAHAHNAEQLESYCINFISKNEEEVLDSRNWRYLKRQAQESLMQTFLQKIREEKEESYVQIAIQNYINRHYPQDATNNNSLKLKKVNQVKKALMNTGSEDEIDLDEMLSTSTYIYLEDHQKVDSYQSFLNNYKVTSSIRTHSTKIPLSSNCVEEEKEPAKGFIVNKQKEDKENISVYSNIELGKQKTKPSPNFQQLGLLQKAKNTLISKKNNPIKKRENKRQPLQQIEEEQQENHNPIYKRASIEDINNSPQEGTAQTPMQSQQTNNCNIFQRI